MTRKIVWSLVAVAVLATLAGLWFLQNFEQVPVTTREGPQKEALRNPYLALERLFSELGRPIERVQSPRLLDALPATGVLILDSNRRRNVDPARAERLLEWVNRGGYLITVPESDGNDPLLTKLGLTSCRTSPKQCGLAEEEDDDADADESDDSTAEQAFECQIGITQRFFLRAFARGHRYLFKILQEPQAGERRQYGHSDQ